MENENALDVGGLGGDGLCAAVETIIFMSDAPVSLEKMGKLLEGRVSAEAIAQAVARLQDIYASSHHGIALRLVAQGYQFRTKQECTKYIPDIFKARSLMLSSTALEVLAVVAYKQPVSKTEIEKIRGVDSSYTIRALIEKRLIRVAGRDEGLGRPTLYATTKEFLETFNLASLSDLPPQYELEEMVSDKVGGMADIKELVSHGAAAAVGADELREVDDIEKTVRAVPASTAFTRRLAHRSKEDATGRGAFDVLDDFMHREAVRRENVRAGGSEVVPRLEDEDIG